MDKPHEFNAERLKNLIAEDKLLQVLEELRYYAKGRDKDIYNELITQSGCVNAVRKERGIGSISFKEEQGEKNRIRMRLNELIDDLDRVYNKNRFIIELRGEIEDFDDDMRLLVTNGLSNLLSMPKSDFEIVGVYTGSIKVVIEVLDISIINEFMIGFNKKVEFEKNKFEGLEFLNIINEKKILEEIVLCFYTILLGNKYKIISVKNILETLNKYELLKKSASWYFFDINFRNQDLRGAVLENANLSGIDLSDVDLRHSNLAYTNLSGTKLIDSNLAEANLTGANLAGVNLMGANLEGANLMGANLNSAKMFHANLYKTNLQGTNLEYVNLFFANLKEANLTKTNLKEAYLSRADLSNVIITVSQLLETRSLFNCKGIDEAVRNLILLTRPELFDNPDDGKKEDVFTKIDI